MHSTDTVNGLRIDPSILPLEERRAYYLEDWQRQKAANPGNHSIQPGVPLTDLELLFDDTFRLARGLNILDEQTKTNLTRSISRLNRHANGNHNGNNGADLPRIEIDTLLERVTDTCDACGNNAALIGKLLRYVNGKVDRIARFCACKEELLERPADSDSRDAMIGIMSRSTLSH